MRKLLFRVAIGYGDAEVEIDVSERDAARLRHYARVDEFAEPEEFEELNEVCERLRKKIRKALEEQIEEDEDVELEDMDFTFGFPEEME